MRSFTMVISKNLRISHYRALGQSNVQKMSHGADMKRTSLRRVSKKRATQNREYLKLRKDFLANALFCEVPDCFNRSEEIHHVNHREGKRLLDTKYFLAVCRTHHAFIHNNPAWARAQGLLK